MDIFRGRSPVGVDPGKIPRLGSIPRYAKNKTKMYWIEVPGFNMLHAVNAWEEEDGEKIVIVASNVLSVEHALESMDLIHLSLEKVEIKVKEKKVFRQPVSIKSLDFGVINPAYIGKKNRYAYAAVTAPMPKIAGVVKLDLSLLEADNGNCTVASRLYG
ncbi:putative carotenoid cleavage dioxygenase 4 [Abeliophyllum distichum]|uniref:Carotenoid cleavage dioxygenase 4 n=1 Tax=Abeliophyllum distichum TaxID=126358 RepID=A0ABD1TX47_9LAMI